MEVDSEAFFAECAGSAEYVLVNYLLGFIARRECGQG